MDRERMWSLQETADYLGVPEGTVRQWLHRGEAPKSYKVGRYRRFRRVEVDAWLDKRAQNGSGAA